MTVESFFDTRRLSFDRPVNSTVHDSSLDSIEEDQLARTFQQIVNFVDMDGEFSETSIKPQNTSSQIPITSTSLSFSSFLDDEWHPIVKNTSKSYARPASNDPSTFYELDSFTKQLNSGDGKLFIESKPATPFSSYSSHPPRDYVCKLCNFSGHWIKDCRLYQPRTTSSLKSFGSNSAFSSSSSSSLPRISLPPSNYICRLCNISGHWIDQCSKFQPKTNSADLVNIDKLPPGMGPTPNYRPPVYLSKPVPTNYLCNLCNRPGHWIQQCPQFTPIIKRH